MPTIALTRWLEDVRRLHARARSALQPDVVHELRVALRRCRSVAQGLKEIDDPVGRPQWRALNEAGRPLFAELGALRDAQVMRDHARALLVGDPALPRLLTLLERRARHERGVARAAVVAFDVERFAMLVAPLPARAAALLEEEALLMHLALRRYEEGRLLHAEAMRTRASASLHALRIRVKRLRYTFESFLPVPHAAVGKLLKKAQQHLGDLHDYDVLLAWLNSEECVLHSDDRARVCAPVRAAREVCLRAYHDLATGPESLWPLVRSTLASDRGLVDAHRAALMNRFGSAATALPLARAADALLHAIAPRVRALRDRRARPLLSWACACIVAGSAKRQRRAVRGLPNAVGLGDKERVFLELLTQAVRGQAPQPHDLERLTARDAALVDALGAVLHLAACVPGRVRIQVGREVVALRLASAVDAALFATRRAPLERVCGTPLWVEVPPRTVPPPSGGRTA